MLRGEMRAEVARILETVATDGLPGPRDLDVALDAIGCVLEVEGVGAVLRLSRTLAESSVPAGEGMRRLPDWPSTRERLARLKDALEQLDWPADAEGAHAAR